MRSQRLDLSDNERAILITTLRRLVDFDPQPRSPQIQALKAILERLEPQKPQPIPDTASTGWARRPARPEVCCGDRVPGRVCCLARRGGRIAGDQPHSVRAIGPEGIQDAKLHGGRARGRSVDFAHVLAASSAMVTQSYPRWANRIAWSGRKAVVLRRRRADIASARPDSVPATIPSVALFARVVSAGRAARNKTDRRAPPTHAGNTEPETAAWVGHNTAAVACLGRLFGVRGRSPCGSLKWVLCMSRPAAPD